VAAARARRLARISPQAVERYVNELNEVYAPRLHLHDRRGLPRHRPPRWSGGPQGLVAEFAQDVALTMRSICTRSPGEADMTSRKSLGPDSEGNAGGLHLLAHGTGQLDTARIVQPNWRSCACGPMTARCTSPVGADRGRLGCSIGPVLRRPGIARSRPHGGAQTQSAMRGLPTSRDRDPPTSTASIPPTAKTRLRMLAIPGTGRRPEPTGTDLGTEESLRFGRDRGAPAASRETRARPPGSGCQPNAIGDRLRLLPQRARVDTASRRSLLVRGERLVKVVWDARSSREAATGRRPGAFAEGRSWAQEGEYREHAAVGVR
jgi:hypothetical protein